MKKQTTITIRANEWFDKINGNSYHNTIIDIDGVRYQSDIQYGYDDQYLQTADHMVKGFNLIPDNLCLYRWRDAEAIKALGINVVNKGKTTTLKRDLLINL